MPLLLSRDELTPLLDLPKAIELIEEAHRQQVKGEIVPHAPYHLHVGERRGLRVVSGAVLKSRRVGIRLGPNSWLGGGDKMYALLFDADTGALLSFMGFPFGCVAFFHGISVWHLANRSSCGYRCKAHGARRFSALRIIRCRTQCIWDS
jgi:hypothetical protein